MEREERLVRVRDVMHREFDWVDGMETVAAALERMQRRGLTALVVKKRHPDDEYGLLLASDIARKVLAPDRAPERVNVYEVMAKPVLTVDADMNIRYCARLFDRFRISQAPVVEGGEVVGLVTFLDLVLRGMGPAAAR
ncbi:CBS domain-containing protein [Inmirania thermothiophila]|uniref:CBS domain protein n=1 Tax=Inmirania thermothiophila TaxID=1750597 RepID=A0A3N1Y9F4_9GAMM|nr:CBS domain-containing protein [Inmirania thermothiophila]ROR35118.1 CBS domain protein [Inmirania thermothiophila]